MNKDVLLNRLSAKLLKYTAEFETLQSNGQIRNIAFGSGGNLSKASLHRLDRHRNKLGEVCTQIRLTELSIRLINEKPFYLSDLSLIANDFLGTRNPEYSYCFSYELFKLQDVKDMLNLIYDVYRFSYRKEILAYGLTYINGHGGVVKIKLV